MNNLIDVTIPMRNGVVCWPGDVAFNYHLSASRVDGGTVNVGAITTSVHSGTHIDATFHFLDEGVTVDAIDPAVYIGPAIVIDARNVNPIPASLFDSVDLNGTPRVLFRTDAWTDHSIFPTSIPTLAPDVPKLLGDAGVVLAGFDLPSVDAIDSHDLHIHHALAAAGVYILEGLALAGVDPGVYELIAVPLLLMGSDGSPVRALLRKP